MSDEAIKLLRSINASLTVLAAQAVKHAPPEIADAADLDSKYGDPVVKFEPRDWSGVPCKGQPMSQCPPAFLDLLAKTFDYFAQKAEETNETYNDKLVAPYKRKDAARARGWAARLRSGYKAPALAPMGHESDF